MRSSISLDITERSKAVLLDPPISRLTAPRRQLLCLFGQKV